MSISTVTIVLGGRYEFGLKGTVRIFESDAANFIIW